ncbi:MAG: HAMP domain-containing histidine kinase [Geobacteraceae bacterium]|nr:HAMP domain-containing histidine kinase [Geobacteraceae bacterium]
MIRAVLRETGEQMSEFLDSQSRVPILWIDNQQRIRDCNRGFLQMFSLSKKPLGADLTDYLIPGDEGVLYEPGHQELTCNPRTGVPGVLVAHRLPHGDGLLLWCERLLNSDNQVVERMALLNNEFIAMQRELIKKNHERGLIQRELEGHIIQLREKNAEIERLIYSVSHDLRSPLVTVKTFLGYLESDMAGDDRERIAQDLQYIHSAADKMELMLDGLLEMHMIGQEDTAQVCISLNEILAEVMASLAGTIRDRNVDFHLSDTDLMLRGDRSHLCQLWQNLVENAIKYSQPGVTPRIEIGVGNQTGEAVFFVRDNGIGIASHNRGNIFGVFQKLDQKSPGAGLGLSIVVRIVEKYGGRIWVESAGEGQGSCFRFTLPGAMMGDG